MDGSDKFLMVGEVEVQERQQQVAAVDGIGGIHRHLAKEVFYLGVDNGEGAQAVPQVVEDEDALGSHTARLVFGSDKRASQFDGSREIVLDKLW